MNFRASTIKLAGPIASNSELLDLDWVARILFERRFILAVATALGGIFSILYLLNATPEYKATTQILIQDQRPRIASGQDIVPMARLDKSVTMLSQVINSQIALIKSPKQIETVIRQLNLFPQPDSSGGESIFEKFIARLNLFEQRRSTDGQSTGELDQLKRRYKQLTQFLRQLTVRRLTQTSIILVSYADTDRERAAKVANAVAKTYIEHQVETINNVKREAVGWLNARAAELRDQVRIEERQVEEYKARNGIVSVGGRLVVGGRSDAMVGLRELELNLKATRDVYAGVLTRLKEAEVQISLHVTQSRIVNHATPPLRPNWPRKSFVLIIASLGSLWVAVAFVLLQEFRLGIVRSSKDVRHKVRYITTLPMVGAGPSQKWFMKLLDQLLPTRLKKFNRIERHTLGDMASPYAQAMFTLNNSMRRAEQAKGGSIFAVVSAQEGEGKTTTALNLADYAANSGKRVLLIDADVRRPTLTGTCAPLPVLSLVDIAEQKVDAAEVIIKGTFDFCPGPHDHSCERPMEILASDGVSRFLREARADYDLMLIDTSPLLTYVDAKALMETVDGMVLIVECNRTTRAQVDEVLEAIGEDSGKLLGFVLTKARGGHHN